eukprot:1325578-Prymnesium_polylepis.1
MLHARSMHTTRSQGRPQTKRRGCGELRPPPQDGPAARGVAHCGAADEGQYLPAGGALPQRPRVRRAPLGRDAAELRGVRRRHVF